MPVPFLSSSVSPFLSSPFFKILLEGKVRVWGSGVGLKRKTVCAFTASSTSSHAFRWHGSGGQSQPWSLKVISRSPQSVESCQKILSRLVGIRAPENHLPKTLVRVTILSRKGTVIFTSASISPLLHASESPGDLVKLRFWFFRSRAGPRFCTFDRLLDDAKLLVPSPYFDKWSSRKKKWQFGSCGSM